MQPLQRNDKVFPASRSPIVNTCFVRVVLAVGLVFVKHLIGEDDETMQGRYDPRTERGVVFHELNGAEDCAARTGWQGRTINKSYALTERIAAPEVSGFVCFN